MPMALGHEASGIVAELGEGVTDLQRGDHVVLVFVPAAAHCPPCAEGRPALVRAGAAANGAGTLLSGQRRLTRNGETVNHHLGCSAFAITPLVSRRSLIKIDPELPFEEAALFGCAVLTGVGAVVNTARSACRRVGRRRGARRRRPRVGASARAPPARATSSPVDLAADKLELAKSLGATHAFNAGSPDAVDSIKEATSARRYAIEMAGSVKAFRPRVSHHSTRRHDRDRRAAAADRDLADVAGPISSPKSGRSRAAISGPDVPSRDLPRFIDLYRQGACRSIG